MFQPQIAALRFAARSVARKATWSAIGAVFLFAAVLFFGVAVWIFFESRYGALNTALGFGLVMTLLGVAALAFSRRPPRVVPKRAARQMQNPMNSPALSTAAIINAVVLGISAGRAVRRRD